MTHLHYKVSGEGHPLVLIHGFPMNMKIWDGIVPDLSKSFRVYTVDLPGFGKSPLLPASFSLKDVGMQVAEWIDQHNITGCLPLGHSLGGYVVLALLDLKPDWFLGAGLIHSTAYPDSLEKKASRDKVVEFIKNNGVKAFTGNFIDPLFFKPNHPDLGKVRGICLEADQEAVIGYALAMRDRPSSIPTLARFQKPILMIGGEKDGGIPPETLLEQSKKTLLPETHILNEVSHMGMFENKQKIIELVKGFGEKWFKS